MQRASLRAWKLQTENFQKGIGETAKEVRRKTTPRVLSSWTISTALDLQEVTLKQLITNTVLWKQAKISYLRRTTNPRPRKWVNTWNIALAKREAKKIEAGLNFKSDVTLHMISTVKLWRFLTKSIHEGDSKKSLSLGQPQVALDLPLTLIVQIQAAIWRTPEGLRRAVVWKRRKGWTFTTLLINNYSILILFTIFYSGLFSILSSSSIMTWHSSSLPSLK